jgi:hypothetical protein
LTTAHAVPSPSLCLEISLAALKQDQIKVLNFFISPQAITIERFNNFQFEAADEKKQL